MYLEPIDSLKALSRPKTLASDGEQNRLPNCRALGQRHQPNLVCSHYII